MKVNPLAVKSLVRDATVGVSFIVEATNTYLSQGHHFGLNAETALGVGYQAATALAAVASRYLDKKDPAFGKIAAPVIKQLLAKIQPSAK